MPRFAYIARNRAGGKENGVEEAGTQEEVITRLQARDLLVIQVGIETRDAAALGAMPKTTFAMKPKSSHNQIKNEDLIIFCRQLATLLGAGVTILKSLDIISQQVASRKLCSVIKNLEKSMEEGVSFYEAMAKHPTVFSDLWINLVESGEASGNLAVVLNRLASYLERDAAFKSKVISALIYPAILLAAGTAALLFLTIKIIPTFAEIFKQFGTTLPFLTRLLIDFSSFLRKFFLIIIGAGIGIFFLLRQFIATKEGRRQYEKFLFKLPIFGDFFRVLVIERFTSEMATLVESGVPILYSLEIAERSTGNLIISDIIHKVKEDVRNGKPLSVPLEKSGFFEPMVVQMVAIGEEIGELADMFKRLNVFYQDYVETFLTRFTSMFEPIILIFMGFVVGIMVVGMFLPIFQIAKMGGGGG